MNILMVIKPVCKMSHDINAVSSEQVKFAMRS